jgi:hypothetical protein
MKYIDVYSYRKNFKKSLNRWHNADKVLPSCPNGSQSFLVAFNGESGFKAVMKFYKGTWWQGTHGEGKDWRETNLVTHWRELP